MTKLLKGRSISMFENEILSQIWDKHIFIIF